MKYNEKGNIVSMKEIVKYNLLWMHEWTANCFWLLQNEQSVQMWHSIIFLMYINLMYQRIGQKWSIEEYIIIACAQINTCVISNMCID